MKQKNAAELRKLQEENRALRRAIKAGEQRRRAAVEEIISLNQRLQAASQTGEMVLMTHDPAGKAVRSGGRRRSLGTLLPRGDAGGPGAQQDRIGPGAGRRAHAPGQRGPGG